MIRALGRALVALLLLCGAPLPAQAQFLDFMDWLERLSGPTLPGWWGDVPLMCRYVDEGPVPHLAMFLSSTGKQPYPTREVGARDSVFELDAKTLEVVIQALTERARTAPVEAAAELKAEMGTLILKLRSLRLSQSSVRFAPLNESTHRCSPVVLGTSKGKVEAIFKRSIVVGVRLGVAGANKPWPLNGENHLTYDSGVSEEQKEIFVFSFGPSFNWSVHPKLDLIWALEWNRFSGPQFETFWRPSIDAIDLAYRPFHRRDRQSVLDVFQVTLRAKKYLGNFSDQDFGATPGTFFAKRESVVSLGASVDITRIIWRR